jgi:hypothetical protein
MAVLLMAGCVETVVVSGANATLRPPDPALVCLTPQLSLQPGAQGTLKWEASVPAGTSITNKATLSGTAGGVNFSVDSNPVRINVAEPTATVATFSWTIPAVAQFVSGTVTKADGSNATIAAPVAGVVSVACGPIAAGEKATIAVVIKAL